MPEHGTTEHEHRQNIGMPRNSGGTTEHPGTLAEHPGTTELYTTTIGFKTFNSRLKYLLLLT